MSDIKIKVGDKNLTYAIDTPIEEVAKDIYPDYKEKVALCIYNGILRELNYKMHKDGEIIFEEISGINGMRTYKRSVIFLLQRALDDIYTDESHELRVMYSLENGYFCKLESTNEVSDELINKIDSKMRELVKEDIPIVKNSVPTEIAKRIFRERGMENKERLLKYRSDSNTNVYSLGETKDYFYGYMLPSTGYLTRFSLHKFDEGFVLQFPNRSDITRVAGFNPPKRLYNILKKSTDWSKCLGIPTVGKLNDVIVGGQMQDTILMQEALMEAQIAEIAQDISERKHVKFIMIAGPSSSGKTTFSHRLSVHLKAQGLIPHPVPLDDFYLNRDQVPLDEFGEKDYECLESLDVKRFNDDMVSLLSGKETDLPIFDFTQGKRSSRTKKLKLGKEDVLVIEGIHGLNDKLSYSLPVESKFKIYISALSMLAVDEHNPLSTSDGRLLRRIVRDARTRNTSAKDTIAMWPSVRRGEIKNIFPFQEAADTMFNTALIYELAVMKLYAEPQLYAINPEDKEYPEAKRLIKLLSYVLPMPTEDIPNNSLIREFIGGSCFKV